jgi:HTH-like domain
MRLHGAAYGARRVHAELRMGRGITVCHNAVQILMRRAVLRGLPERKRWRARPDIGKLADKRGFLLADLARLFHGHGVASNTPWFVQVIDPNLAGATAIAEHWHELLTSR